MIVLAALLGLALAIATSGCTYQQAPEPALTVPASEADLVGPWTDLSTGQQVPEVKPGDPLLVTVFASSNGCSYDGITLILRVGWPLGTEVGPPYDMPSFLRETTGANLKTWGESDLDAELPADPPAARFASRAGSTIRIDAEARWAYVERPGGRVERWARLASNVGECA